MDILERVSSAFRQTFHAEPAFIARAPGRVNLLGEHVDYNDGWVLPVAIDRAAYVAARPRADSLVALTALDLNESVQFELTALADQRDVTGALLPGWARYAAGVAWALTSMGRAVHGMNAMLTADVPRGSGLSSSAAVEVAFATAWQRLGGWALTPMEKARACQRAENHYVGVNCGLMDQFASACGAERHALLLDCRSLDWETVPLPEGASIIVADTTVRRELGHSEYNLRRAHCEEAVRILKEPLPTISALRDVAPEDFNRYAALLLPVVQKRARHVVEECARTQKAARLLRAGEAAQVGALMNECHASLRDLYEVSCPELDVMVDAAQKIEGCYGARLTGAGFGGCTVNLVAAAAAQTFTRTLAAHYTRATSKTPEIYVCRASAGAGIVLSTDARR